MFAFKIENNLLAERVTGFFIKGLKIHSYGTRHVEKMIVLKFSETAAQKSVRYGCGTVWNYSAVPL